MIHALQNMVIKWMAEFSFSKPAIAIDKSTVNYMRGEFTEPISISIFPNPAKSGSSIDIFCNRLKPSYYQIQLLNKNGQMVMNMKSWIDGDEQVLNIQLPNLSPGLYTIRISRDQVWHEQKLIIS